MLRISCKKQKYKCKQTQKQTLGNIPKKCSIATKSIFCGKPSFGRLVARNIKPGLHYKKKKKKFIYMYKFKSLFAHLFEANLGLASVLSRLLEPRAQFGPVIASAAILIFVGTRAIWSIGVSNKDYNFSAACPRFSLSADFLLDPFFIYTFFYFLFFLLIYIFSLFILFPALDISNLLPPTHSQIHTHTHKQTQIGTDTHLIECLTFTASSTVA